MRLIRLKSMGFGSLRGEHVFDTGRLTLLVDENERGKSTMLAAIAAALYGLSDDKRSHRPLTPLERWKPWDGGPYGVEVELECGGERYTVTRDFEHGTVAVWNGRGQELTAQFLDGKDEYPVGKQLLGLDAEEFEKCAFVRQEDLDQVVPADEKDRRTNSLQARLERAADTRAGNSSAAEALRVLEQAAARYSEPLLDTTLRIENAIQRLDTKVATLDAEIHALEHDHRSIQPQLDRLAEIEDEERRDSEQERRLNDERRAALRAEASGKLDRHHRACAELVGLEREAQELAPFAGVAPESDGEIRQLAARLEETERQRGQHEIDHQQLSELLAQVDLELDKLAAFASLGEQDANRFIAQAAELRRLGAERDRVRAELERARAELAAGGFDPGVIARLEARCGAIDEATGKQLAEQPGLALELQAGAAEIDQELDRCDRQLAVIARGRKARAIPGAVLLGLGVVAGVLAVLQGTLQLAVSWQVLAAVAGGLAIAGGVMLMLAATFRSDDRAEAMGDREAARRALAALTERREANDLRLGMIARAAGCDDIVDLLRSWREWQRLLAERQPAQRLERELHALEESHAEVMRQAGNPPDPGFLEEAARGVRTRTLMAQERRQLEEQARTTGEHLEQAGARVADLEAKAQAVLARAGFARRPAAPWPDIVAEVARRAQAARRVAALTDELIPRTRAHVMRDEDVLQNEQTLVMLELDEARGEAPAEARPVRSLAEIERDSQTVRGQLDRLRQERGELRLRVDDVTRRFHKEHPEKLIEREAFARASLKAGRFKAAVELARGTIEQVALETHRRWAEFLNRRVSQILGTVGAGVEQVRFGEDLDFAVKPRRGQQVSRGKAVRQLSSGARDQLHLALRLAISEYLSREEPLPLLIDDCFATSDDARARAGMKILIEQFLAQHQVVLVTCHRRRFEALAGADHDLYAQRVHWVDIQSMRLEAAPQPQG